MQPLGYMGILQVPGNTTVTMMHMSEVEYVSAKSACFFIFPLTRFPLHLEGRTPPIPEPMTTHSLDSLVRFRVTIGPAFVRLKCPEMIHVSPAFDAP